jgi:hypothetical protein
MTERRERWFDDAAGPLVRPYAVTRGRTGANRPELNMLTQVVAVESNLTRRRPEPEYTEILRLCQSPLSIAEVAAALRRPLLVTKILVGDLIDDGVLVFRTPAQPSGADVADINIMRAVLDGIRRF